MPSMEGGVNAEGAFPLPAFEGTTIANPVAFAHTIAEHVFGRTWVLLSIASTAKRWTIPVPHLAVMLARDTVRQEMIDLLGLCPGMRRFDSDASPLTTYRNDATS